MTDTLPNSLTVPTNDPAKTAAEYARLGFRWEQLYSGHHERSLCQGKLWALRIWRPQPKQQPELI